jgi:ParB/RepB/Spo0J family partition protein
VNDETHTSRDATGVRRSTEKRLMKYAIVRIRVDPNQPRKEFDEKSLEELANNLTQLGQLTPLIAYFDPSDPEYLVILDGERRWRAAQRAGWVELEVLVLPVKPAPAELLLAQLSLGTIRERLSLFELEVAYTRLINELGHTQSELARRLGVSPTKVSNVFSTRRISLNLRPQAERLERCIVPLIARLSQSEQPAVIAYATQPLENGALPSREQVQRFIEARKAKSKPARAKALRGNLGDRSFHVELKEGDTHDSVTEWAKVLMNFLQKHKNLPVAHLSLVAR